MTSQIEISKDQYIDSLIKYHIALAQLSPELRKKCPPNFDKFLSPANYTNFDNDPIGLSVTGTERYKMVWSPHVVTLLAVYAAQRI